MKIASLEFEQFLNDATKYQISNLYLNNHDIQYLSETKKDDIIYIGSGIVIELNNSIMYEFGSGIGVCDYHLKFSKPTKFPISENYLSIKDSEINSLKELIGKKPSWLIPKTCHQNITVLMSLEIRNHDKTKFKIIGTHFETLIENQMIQHYDGAWILTNKIKIENAKII